MGINSFVIMPIVFIFVIYTGMKAVFSFEWKPFLIAFIVLVIGLIAQVVLATMQD